MCRYRDGITVIIPVYNRAERVKGTLLSIEKQTRRPEKIILVDNNSSDNSFEVLSQWAEQHRDKGWDVELIEETSPGASTARKAGEKLVDTKYVYFFDSDDIMHSDLIEKAMKDFEDNPELKISAWSLRFNRPDGTYSRRRIHKSRPLENHLVQSLLSTQAYASDTEYFRKAGGWNPEIGGWDDWELGLRLLLGGGKMKIADEVRVEIAVHEKSITGLSYLHRKGDWEKTIDTMEIAAKSSSHIQREKILKLLAYRRAILAAHYRREGDRTAALNLLSEAFAKESMTPFSRLVLRMAYAVTSAGMRGAGAIFPSLL